MLILLDFAVIYLCDIDEVPDFNQMYELYDTMTIMFFYRNKHMMCDFGTGNNNKLNWVLEDKQELIDIIETIYKGAKKGRGLVVSPKGMLSIIAYVAQVRRLNRLQIILHDTDTKKEGFGMGYALDMPQSQPTFQSTTLWKNRLGMSQQRDETQYFHFVIAVRHVHGRGEKSWWVACTDVGWHIWKSYKRRESG